MLSDTRYTSSFYYPQGLALEDSVKQLCDIDRRAINKEGTKKTLHYLSDQIKQAGFKALLHKAPEIPISGVRNQVIGGPYLSQLSWEQKKEILDFIPNSKRNQTLVISNIYTRIGDPNGKKIILGAHYDMDLSIEKGAGADDNASGVAVLLQLAKNLKAHEKKFADAGLCVEIVFFGAEERPFDLTGSQHYSKQFISELEKSKVKLMINLDMVGYFDDNRDLDIWPGKKEFTRQDSFKEFFKKLKGSLPKKENYYVVESYGREDPKLLNALLDLMSKQAFVTEHFPLERLRFIDETTKEAEQHDFSPGRSDHDSFRMRLFPTISIHANSYRNKNYHTQKDTPETLDYNRMSRLLYSLENFLLSLTEDTSFQYKH